MLTRICLGLLATLALCAVAEAEVYQWVDESGQRHFSDSPPPGQSARAPQKTTSEGGEAAALNSDDIPEEEAAIPGSWEVFNHPAASKTLAIRRLFEDKEFEQLNQLLHERLNSVQTDISRDRELQAAYEAFELNDPSWEPLFEQWIDQFPEEYAAYLARATYHTARAWEARGGNYISETPSAKIEDMKHWLMMARKDIYRALSLNDRSLWAYCLQINGAKATGKSQTARDALKKSIEQYPANFIARQFYLETLDPKWGGSWKAMLRFAKSAQDHVGTNPNIKQLLPYAFFEAARMAYIDERYQQTVDLLSIVLKHSRSAEAHYLRSKSYRRLGELDEALLDVDEAIERDEDNGSYFYTRAAIHAEKERYDESLTAINRAHALEPNDPAIKELRGALLSFIKHPDDDLMAPDDKNSAGADSQSAEAFLKLAKQHASKGQLSDAKAYLDKAITRRPEAFRYYRAMDHVLFKMGKTREILGYWERYLSKKARDGRAYYERSGTYYHLQNYELAAKDAKRAMDLGVDGAEKRYRQMRELAQD